MSIVSREASSAQSGSIEIKHRSDAETALWERIVAEQMRNVVPTELLNGEQRASSEGQPFNPNDVSPRIAVMADMSAQLADRIIRLRRVRTDRITTL